MSLGGPPLKMRLKKSCKSAGLVGPGACSEGVLKGKGGKIRDALCWSNIFLKRSLALYFRRGNHGRCSTYVKYQKTISLWINLNEEEEGETVYSRCFNTTELQQRPKDEQRGHTCVVWSCCCSLNQKRCDRAHGACQGKCLFFGSLPTLKHDAITTGHMEIL